MFEDVIGQDEAIRDITEEMRRGRMNHAYLFEGPEGTGRCTFARALAAATLGRTPRTLDTHPDFLELPRDVSRLRIRRFVERDTGSNETIDHVPVVPFLQLRPVQAERRVCLIPDAERMETGSANAFLKTLEEPPGGALLLLTTSARDRLLPTIVSRCRRIRVCPLPEAVLTDELAKRDAGAHAEAAALAVLAEGSLGTALRLAGGETLDTWRWIESALAQNTPVGAVHLGQGLIERARGGGSDAHARRQAAARLLDMMALHIRHRLRKGLDPRAAREALAALWQAGEEVAANVRTDLVLHAAALNTVAALRKA